jgi:hypothetical protein
VFCVRNVVSNSIIFIFHKNGQKTDVNLVIQFQWALLNFYFVTKTEDERVYILHKSYAWAVVIKLSHIQLCLEDHLLCPCVCPTVRPSSAFLVTVDPLPRFY